MTRRRRAFAVLLTCVLACLPLTGCWDRRELEERTSVVAMAIDRVEQPEGRQPLVKLSVQIPIPIKITGAGGAGGGQGGKSAVKVMSATGFSMADAMRNLQQRLNQQLFYGHTRVIAVSQDVASEHMEAVVDSLRRSPQMRRLLWMVVTSGEAVGLLRSDPKLEQIPIVYVMDLLENGSQAGTVPDMTLGRWFIDRSSSGVDAMTNFIQATEQEVKWHGLALFRDDKLVGHLEENESWVLLNAKDSRIGGDVTITCPESVKRAGGSYDYLTVHPKKLHVKSKVVPYEKSFKMTVDILMEQDVVESMCGYDFTKPETYPKLEKAVADEMNGRAKKLVDDLQNKYNVDVLGMGNKVRAHYLEQYEKLDWREEYPKAKIEIRYSVRIRRVGMKME